MATSLLRAGTGKLVLKGSKAFILDFTLSSTIDNRQGVCVARFKKKKQKQKTSFKNSGFLVTAIICQLESKELVEGAQLQEHA